MTGIRKRNLGFYIAFKFTKKERSAVLARISRIPSAIDAFLILTKKASQGVRKTEVEQE